jgi:low temperature requirement A protein (LtrA)
MGLSAAVILASALLMATPRLLVWAGLGVAWIVGIVLAARSSHVGLGLTPTDSLVERFGLFTIIVLGEVVIGVVAGLSAAERDAKTIVTGMLALWDATAPAGTSWLLAGAVATGLLALVLTEQALVDVERLFLVFHPSAWRIRRRGCGPDRRLGATGAVAPRVAAGGDPIRGLVLRRQPLPARRRLGRTMTGA